MGLAQNADSLGPPALNLAGFQLWIHGRQFRDSQDYWDGNWLNVTAHCGSNGASVWASGAIIMVSDLVGLATECEALCERGQGEAVLQPCEPNLLLHLRPLDKRGHNLMHVEITPDHMTQQHRFDFEIDQSYLPSLVAQCKAVIAEYPIRGNAGG
jgi:hypothetical protein